MSEGQAWVVASEAGLEAGVNAASPGALLRQARQAAGVHVAALAVSLKVPISKLEALEADNFEAFPDAVFVRALAGSVCRALKMDAAPVLALMPSSAGPRPFADIAGINATFKDRSERAWGGSFASQIARPVSLAVLALLVGAIVLAFLPHTPDLVPEKAAENTALPPLESVRETAVSPHLAAPVEAVQQALAVPEVAPEAASATAPMPVVAPEVVQEKPVAAAPSSGNAVIASADILVFRASNPSWVQVRDAAGAIMLDRILAAGESATISGKLPLSVVVGRKDAMEVFVRGNPYDLVPVSRGNVARFEVTQ